MGSSLSSFDFVERDEQLPRMTVLPFRAKTYNDKSTEQFDLYMSQDVSLLDEFGGETVVHFFCSFFFFMLCGFERPKNISHGLHFKNQSFSHTTNQLSRAAEVLE